jgi:hypothetical protein
MVWCWWREFGVGWGRGIVGGLEGFDEEHTKIASCKCMKRHKQREEYHIKYIKQRTGRTEDFPDANIRTGR